jgi:pimeloyl-ACP methyl ester carboxylesterase
MPTYVPSADGVEVAVHDQGGPTGESSPIAVFAHATGFHGRVWEPLAAELADRVCCFALDLRGHGVAHTPEALDFHWRGFAADVVAVLDSGVLPTGRPVLGVGHSMGGAALVLAAQARPDALAALWLFEPIVPPPGAMLSSDSPNPLADGAARRRARFESVEAAIANFAAKPPLDALRPDALRAYVEGGFAVEDDGTAVLRCRPEWEAATFRMARHSGAWEALSDLDIPVVVAVGADEQPFAPSAFASAIVADARHGRLSPHPELGHFGPLEQPDVMAEEIAAFATTL